MLTCADIRVGKRDFCIEHRIDDNVGHDFDKKSMLRA